MERRIQEEKRTVGWAMEENSLQTEDKLENEKICGFSYKSVYEKHKLVLPSIEKIADFISEILNQIIKQNLKKPKILSIFDAKKEPSISIQNYLARIAKYSRISVETLILGIIYIDRYINVKQDYFLNSYNVHKYSN
jgi:hypothetical protein